MTPQALRGVTVPPALSCPPRRIRRWLNNILVCQARPQPPFFWDLRNLALCTLTILECLQSWCLSIGPSPKDLALIPAPTPGSTLPCSRCQSSPLTRAVLCALTPSKAREGGIDDTVIQKSWRTWDLPAQLSAGCPYYKLVCVLPYACLFLSGGGGGGSGSLELTPGHPQNKGGVVLLKSRTEAKLLPPEKGGNRGRPVAWRRTTGL